GRGVEVADRGTDVEVDTLGRLGRRGLAYQVEVDATLAALEVQVDAAGRGACNGTAGEQRVLRGELLAHDQNLFPLARGGLATGLRELTRSREELLLVAPDEEDFKKLQFQVAPVRLTADGDADEIGGLVVEPVGHVEISLGQGITLIEVDGRLAADRLVACNV